MKYIAKEAVIRELKSRLTNIKLAIANIKQQHIEHPYLDVIKAECDKVLWLLGFPVETTENDAESPQNKDDDAA